ncbi:FAD-dependent monooxygenase OpS4-like protein [Cladobotryum mycophilum]|uniref:FAD-dependent monooxygenase OpS4-like protein n=1 Tax=Cladobotryum mycophilum TaxID=491253 RepID=A0ABR0SBK3_9HYPO
MRIIIVGAGIAGLSLAISLAQSGRKVRLLDSAAQLAEIGAGIQMTPQAVKYLFKWGLKDDILAESLVPSRMHVRDSKDGSLLCATRLHEFEKRYEAPYIVVHRAALHAILHRHAVRAGAEILLNSRVIEYDFENGVVQLQNGDKLEADLIIAADGINSSARSQLLQSLDPGSQPTGWAAYRLMTEVSKIKADPELAPLADLETHSSNFWIAGDKSCMTYLVKNATMLNIVLSHHDDIDTSKFSQEEYSDTVDELFKEFEPRVRRLIQLAVPKTANYPVYAVPPLPYWAHSSGRFTLVGDAAHAMAFYLSMGVSLAVEDAVSLTTVLDLACPVSAATKDSQNSLNAENVRAALHVFETVRKKRAQAVQDASLEAGNTLHVPEGRGRELLYEALREANEDLPVNMQAEKLEQRRVHNVSSGISDKATRDWCYGYDAIGDITANWTHRLEGSS